MFLDNYYKLESQSVTFDCYRIVINLLLHDTDYSKDTYLSIENDIATNIDNDNSTKFKQMENLNTNPSNVSQMLFLFIGFVEDADILSILDYIVHNKQIKKEDIDILNSYFNYNVSAQWNISNKYISIHFIYNKIYPDDTINYLYTLVSSEITKATKDTSHKIVLENDTICMFTNNSINLDSEIIDIINTIKIDCKNKGYNYTLNSLKNSLKIYGISDNIIDSIFLKYKNNIININEILGDSNLYNLLKISLQFTPIEFSYTYKNIKIPTSTYIPQYFTINNHLNIDRNQYKVVYHNTNNLIQNITDSNTFYLYSFYNIFSLQKDMKINDIDISTLYGIFLKKMFPKIDRSKYKSKSAYTNSEIKEVISRLDTLSYYINTTKYYKKYTLLPDCNINLSIKSPMLLNLGYHLILPPNYNLLNIFNSLPLSYSIPFTKYKDSSNYEILYKVYKPITQRIQPDYIPEITKEELYSWIKYKNYELDSFKIKKIKANTRGLFYKVKIDEISDSVELLNSKIISIKQIEDVYTSDILYNSEIYTNIPHDYITGDISIGNIVSFKNKKNIYVDIEIFKNGKINVNADISHYNDDKYNKNNYIFNNLVEKVNAFIIKIYQSDKILNSYQSYISLIKTNAFMKKHIYNHYNLSYKLDLINPYPFTFQKLTSVLSNLYPLVHLNEYIYTEGEKIEYYDEKKNTWINSTIESMNHITKDGEAESEIIETFYKINANYGNNLFLKIDNVHPKYIRKINDETDRSIITFYLKKIPNFDESGSIKNYIMKLNSLGFDNQQIVNKVMEKFIITKEKATAEIGKSLHLEGIDSIDKLNTSLYPTISIDYMNKKSVRDGTSSSVYIENISNVYVLEYAIKFLYFCIDIYNTGLSDGRSYNLNDTITQYIDFQKKIGETNIEKSKKDTYTTLTNINTSPVSDDSQSDVDDFFEDMGFDDLDEENQDIEDSDEETDITENLLKEIREDSILVGQKKQNKNIILDRLIDADTELFFWRTPGYRSYTQTCQSIDRHPKVFTEEEKIEIDKRDSVFFEKNYSDSSIRSYNNKSSDTNNCSYSSSLPENNECSAIKYGSRNNKGHWYTCPKIYDVIDNVPLHWKMLTYDTLEDGSTFEPKDYEDIKYWRVDKTTNKDILHFNPKYKGREVIPLNTDKLDATSKKSLFLMDVGNFYNYPGVLKSNNHPLSLYSPCCYQGSSKNIDEAFSKINKTSKINGYIQGWGKDLGYLPPRIGLLPDKLSNILNHNNITNCTTGEMEPNKAGFYRTGIKQGNESFLNLLSNIYYNSNNNQTIKNFIIDSLNVEDFKSINKGTLDINFRNYGKQSSYQNFMEYTLSSEFKEYMFYYEILSRPSQDLLTTYKQKVEIKDVAIIIFKIDNNEEINILCPYFSNLLKQNYNNITHIALAIKNNNSFEPIYYYPGNLSAIKLFRIDHPILKQILKSYKTSCNNNSNLNDMRLISAYSNRSKFTQVYTLEDVLDVFLIIKKNKNELLYPKFYLFDDYNRIYGIFLNNQVVIPIYPITINKTYYDFINKHLGIIINNARPTLSSSTPLYNLINLKDHLDTYKIFNKLSNGKVEIVPVYYFHENEHITGFITNTGSNINVKHELKSNQKNIINSNYSNVDNKIKQYQQQLFSNVYVDPIKFEILDNIIKNTNDDMYEFRHYYMNEKSLIYALKTKNNIFIPITETSIDVITKVYPNIIKGLHQDIVINDIDSFIDKTITLSKKVNYKIPIIPSGTLMETDTKKITTIILNCGFEIPINKSQHFYIGEYVPEPINDYKINLFMNEYFQINLYNNIDIDSIIKTTRYEIVNNLEYENNVYLAIQYLIFRFFQNIENEFIKDFCIRIIDNESIKYIEKRIILTPIIIFIINYLIHIIDIPNKNKINIENICDFEKCIGDNCIFIENISTSKLDISEFVWNILILLNNKFTDNDYLDEFIKKNKLKRNVNNRETIIKHFTGLFNKSSNLLDQCLIVYNKLISSRSPSICKLKVNMTIKDTYKIKYKLIDEIIRNDFIKSQLFESFKLSDKGERYKSFHNEIIIYDKELSNKHLINDLYKTIRKTYYQTLVHFDDIEYKLQIDQQDVTQKESNDQCILGKPSSVKFVFTNTNKSLLNNSKKNNIYKPSIKEYNEMFNHIIKINTNLTTKISHGPYTYKCTVFETKKILKSKLY